MDNQTIEMIKDLVIKKLKDEYYLVPKKFKENTDLEGWLLERLLHFVCAAEEVDVSATRGGNQLHEYVQARYIFFFIVRTLFRKEFKLRTIGSFVNKDHSSVKAGILKMEELMYVDKKLASHVSLIMNEFIEANNPLINKVKNHGKETETKNRNEQRSLNGALAAVSA